MSTAANKNRYTSRPISDVRLLPYPVTQHQRTKFGYFLPSQGCSPATLSAGQAVPNTAWDLNHWIIFAIELINQDGHRCCFQARSSQTGTKYILETHQPSRAFLSSPQRFVRLTAPTRPPFAVYQRAGLLHRS